MRKTKCLLFSVMVMAVVLAFGLYLNGCASYQLQVTATTQPITLQQRIDAARSDLTTGEDLITLTETLHKFTPAQQKAILEAEHSAEVALSTAQLATDTKLTTADDAIKAATAAIQLFKSSSK